MKPEGIKNEKMDSEPDLFVDDILALTTGDDARQKMEKAMEETLKYLNTLGAKVSVEKSFTFASTTEDRAWLEEKVWDGVKTSNTSPKKFQVSGSTGVNHGKDGKAGSIS